MSLRALHIGGYWRGPNDTVRQMMLGLRASGCDVFEFNTDEHPEALDFEGRPYDRGRFGPVWLRWEALEPVIQRFRPELIVCNAGGLSFAPEISRQLASRTLLLGIALSDPDVFQPSTSRIAANFHLFLTVAADCLPGYAALGANARPIPLATNEEYFRPVPSRPDLRCEVLVVGRDSPDRLAPVRELGRHFDLRVFGEGWTDHGIPAGPPIYGDELSAALNSAQITVLFPRTPAGHSIPKIAILDFIAAGALVATEPIPEITAYLEPERHFIPFAGPAGLVPALRAALASPERAARIRQAGRETVLTHYTWAKTWPRIIADVRDSAARGDGVARGVKPLE